MKRVATSFIFALLAALAVGYVQRQRDIFFEHDWAKPNGKLETSVSPALVVSARELAETQNPGKVCVLEALAHDDKYIYVGLGCANFHVNPLDGDSGFRAARFRFSGDRAYGFERADPRAYENSVHRLFPRAVYEKLWAGLALSDYLAAGRARSGKK